MKVKQILSENIEVEGTVSTITKNRILIKSSTRVSWPGKHAWLVLNLPTSAKPIRILGKFLREAGDGNVEVEVKHMFPSYKRMLLEYLTANA